MPLPWKEWCHWPQLNDHWPACCSMTWHDLTCAGSNSFCLFLSLFVFFCLFLALSVFFCLFLSFLVFFCNFVKANHIGPYPIDSNPVLWVLIRKFQECAWRCPSCTYWGSPCRTVWCWDALAWFHRHVMSCSLAWAFSSPLGSWWQLHVLWLLLSIGY